MRKSISKPSMPSNRLGRPPKSDKEFWADIWENTREGIKREWLDEPCLERTSSLVRGYSMAKYKGKSVRLAKLVLEKAGLVRKSDEQVRHECDNPPCILLKHLRFGTAKQNAEDRSARNARWVAGNTGQQSWSHKPAEAGERFGRYTILGYAGAVPHGKGFLSTYHVKCDCGNLRIIDINKLRSGNTKSCGCLRRDLLRAKHAKARRDRNGP